MIKKIYKFMQLTGKQILESKISKYMERNQSPRKLYYTTCLFNGWSEEGYKYFF